MRDCVVVGCGRSGTSMTAGVLSASGYATGARLLPANEANPRGYFEDVGVIAVNEDLLAPYTAALPLVDDRGLRLRGRALVPGERWLAALPPDVDVSAPADVEARTAGVWEAGGREAGRPGTPARCLKDPRLCYTLPAWRTFDDALRVCVFREPAATAHSILGFMRSSTLGLTWEGALDVWTSSYRSVTDRLWKEGDWVVVHYDQVLDGSALPRLQQALGVELDGSFGDSSLRRSPRVGDVPAEALHLYEHLCEVAGHLPDSGGRWTPRHRKGAAVTSGQPPTHPICSPPR